MISKNLNKFFLIFSIFFFLNSIAAAEKFTFEIKEIEILENGNIIKGLDVLAYSYELIGLGWIYYPLKIEFLAPVLRFFYKYWAKYRLKITGRSNIEKLCTSECKQ